MADTGVNPKLPTWDGDWRTFSDYRLACQLEKDGLKDDEQITLAPKLARNLTGRAWEACLDIDRTKLRKEDGLDYLLEYLKEKRGRQKVDILGEALEKYFASGDAVRHDRENLNDFEQRILQARPFPFFVLGTVFFCTWNSAHPDFVLSHSGPARGPWAALGASVWNYKETASRAYLSPNDLRA